VSVVLQQVRNANLRGSIVFDHFGLLGVPVHEFSATRLLGAALLAGSVVLIRI